MSKEIRTLAYAIKSNERLLKANQGVNRQLHKRDNKIKRLQSENQFLKRFIKHCLWDDFTNWEKELGDRFDYDFSEPSFKELAEYCEELKGELGE